MEELQSFERQMEPVGHQIVDVPSAAVGLEELVQSEPFFAAPGSRRWQTAREIDDAGRRLVSAAFRAEQAIAQLPQAFIVRELLDKASEALDSCAEALQQLALNLKPRLPDDLGLIPAIHGYLGWYRSLEGVNLEADLEHPDGEVNPDTELAIFRIIEEAVSNAHNHSGATTVRVRLAFRGGNAQLEVSDNGAGFDPGQEGYGPLGRPSQGLQDIRDRATAVGGQLQVETHRFRGTTVRAVLPAATRSEVEQSGSGATVRVLVVHDHGIVREGICALLEKESGITVAGSAGSAEEAINCLRETGADVAVVDASLSGMGPIEAIHKLREVSAELGILALTLDADEQPIAGMLDAGADCYLLQESMVSNLIKAVKSLSKRKTLTDPLAGKEYASATYHPRELYVADSALTDREKDILKLIGQGCISKEIARKLFLSPKTVENYRARILEKLDVKNCSEAVSKAIKQRFISQ